MAAAFARGVAELGTFPDKSKIDVLAMLASDALGDAEAVSTLARILLDSIYAAPPPRKLPLVYIVDAIVKMRGGAEFQAALAPEIAQCFEAAYSQVMPPEQVKLQKTLATWLDLHIFPSETPRLQASIPAYVKPPPQQAPPQPVPASAGAHFYGGAPPFHAAHGAVGGMGPYGHAPQSFGPPPPQFYPGGPPMLAPPSSLGPGYGHPSAMPQAAGSKRPRHAVAGMDFAGPFGGGHDGYYAGGGPMGVPAGGPMAMDGPFYGGGPGPYGEARGGYGGVPGGAGWPPHAGVSGGGTSPPYGPPGFGHGQVRGGPGLIVAPGTRVQAAPPVARYPPPQRGFGGPAVDHRQQELLEARYAQQQEQQQQLAAHQQHQAAMPAGGSGGGLARLLSRIKRPAPAPEDGGAAASAAAAAAASEEGLPEEGSEAAPGSSDDGDGAGPLPYFADQSAALLPGDQLHPATTDVSAATLALPDAAAVRLLLDMQPFVCRQCGARFPYDAGLDAHRAEHAADAGRTRGVSSRVWFAPADDWVAAACGSGPPAQAAAKSFFELQEEAEEAAAAAAAAGGDSDARSIGSADADAEAQCVPAPTPDVPCAICGEPFRKRYDDAAEAYVYTGAAAAADGSLHHVACARALLPPEPPPSPPAPVFDSDAAAHED